MCYNDLNIGLDKWQSILTKGAEAFGVEISFSQIKKMKIHADELVKWNRVSNFTAITNPIDVVVKHFLDSLAPVPFIDKYAKLLDLGSGAGFPGLPLKVVIPSLFVTMVDSSRKKNSFLKHVIRLLKVNNTFAVRARCEHIMNLNQYRESFDVIICRAFTSLDKFIAISVPFLSKNGTLIALKGRLNHSDSKSNSIKIDTNFSCGNKLFSVEKYHYQLPIVRSSRNIVFMKHVG